MYTLALTIILLLVNNVYGYGLGGGQCPASDYRKCGLEIKNKGYGHTCTFVDQCRDCIGCLQACSSLPCKDAPGSTSSDFVSAGQYIIDNADKLGWLALCCESNAPSSKKYVGCEQAGENMCKYVYPWMKQSLGNGGGFSFGKALSENDKKLDTNVNNNNNNFEMIKFGIEIYFIGLLSGIVLISSILGLTNCVCGKYNKYKKVNAYESDNSDSA